MLAQPTPDVATSQLPAADLLTHLREDAAALTDRGISTLLVCGKRPLDRWRDPIRGPLPTTADLLNGKADDRVTGVAVLCGRISDGLAVADFDSLAGYSAWAERFPTLARSLPTVATARGRHLWFRGDVERIKRFAVGRGEYRGRGIVVAPRSLHPSGCRYRWLIPLGDRLPEVESSIFLSTGCIRMPLGCGSDTCTGSDTSDRGTGSDTCPTTVGEVFNRTLPQGPGERNNRLWDLARGLRINLGLDLAAAEPIVREWHRRALAHVTTRDFGTTWAEYCRAHERARFPLGADPLRVAAAMVRRGELPPVASAFQSEATRKLIALCESLARLNADGGRFFLSSHVAAEIIDRKQPQTLGLLHRLCERGVIALTERGNRFRANRYVWLAGGTGKGDGR